MLQLVNAGLGGAMESFRLGSEHEFVEIVLPACTEPDGWFLSPVSIRVGGFAASAAVYLQTSDMGEFFKRLSELHVSLSGVAELQTMERQLVLRIEANGRGSIDVAGMLWSHATYGSRLEFEFRLDQTFLVEVLRTLGRWIKQQTHRGASYT